MDGMTFLITCCRRCDAEYEMDRADIAAGYRWWSLCPACRLADANEMPAMATAQEGEQ